MFRRILIAAFALSSLALCNDSYGQRKGSWSVGVNVGLATFSMKDLKAYQREKQQAMPFDARVTESFPSFLNYSVSGSYTDSTRFYDIFIGRTSTGGRLSYSDYSGSYTSDLTAQMQYVGGSIGFRVARIGKVNMFTSVQAMLYANELEEETSLVIQGVSTEGEINNYVSLNFGVGPAIDLHRTFKSILVRFQGAYEFHLAGRLINEESDADEQYMVNSKHEEIRLQAGGARVKLGIAYVF